MHTVSTAHKDRTENTVEIATICLLSIFLDVATNSHQLQYFLTNVIIMNQLCIQAVVVVVVVADTNYQLDCGLIV